MRREDAAPASASASASAPPHPALDLLRRYGAVLKAAWQARAELAGPRLLAEEAAFLPAALSLQHTPVHPAPRRTLWLIMALFVAALAWAVLGQVDIVAVAPGKIVVSDRTKLIQPLEPALVRRILVKDGDAVQAGQLLVELDPTASSADQANVLEQRQAAESDAAQARALLQALASGAPPALRTASLPDQARLAAEWADIDARRVRLAAEVARREAELTTTGEALAKIEASLPLVRQRETNVKSLADEGFATGHQSLERTQIRIELERDQATQRARIVEVQSALAESRSSQAAWRAETRRTLNDRAVQATLKAAQLRQEGQKTEQRERQTRLTAPVAGTVQQLAIHTAGGVVTAAQPLMVIVPQGAQLNAEVVLDNKDIGFVRPGQVARIKLDTFNFTRYGTVAANVQRVTADAVVDEKRGAVFPVTLQLQQREIQVDGRAIALAPGMNLVAEISTGRRRVIEYLWSPLQRAVDESLKER